MDRESAKLSEYELSHAPTIGDMYEGLSKDLLDKGIPDDLDLRVVEGFVVDAEGKMSGQIDCMLVTGEGERIPYSDSFKWPVWKVLAVVEVKKNLYGAELKDSFEQLREVEYSFERWLFDQAKGSSTISLRPAMSSFSRITGVHAPEYRERESLPLPLQVIYHTLAMSQLAPVRIVLGYNGYKTLKSLREGLITFLESEGSGEGYGVPSFPDQITCNGNSLVKLHGHPYAAPMNGPRWCFYASTSANPVTVMLELIWSKIAHTFDVTMPWGEDLETEVLHPLLSGEIVTHGSQSGWKFYSDSLTDDQLAGEKTESWSPTQVNVTQFVVFSHLCEGMKVDISDPGFVSLIEQDGESIESFLESLKATGHIAVEGTLLRLTSESLKCAILPNEGYVVAEDNTGRFTRYVQSSKARVVSAIRNP